MMEMNVNDMFEDSNVWIGMEIQQLLSIIDEMNLSCELTLESLSPTAIQLISDELSLRGCHKSLEQVETVLVSLKKSYLNSKHALSNSINAELCPYYGCLDKIWGSSIHLDSRTEMMDIANENIKDKCFDSLQLLHKNIPNIIDLSWSDNETIQLLNLVNKMDLAVDFFYKLSSSSIEKLVIPLAKYGYDRSCYQIIEKMKDMRDNYLKCICGGRTPEAIANCPFFHEIDEIFQQLSTNNDESLLHPTDHDYNNKFEASSDRVSADGEKINESTSKWQQNPLFADNEKNYCESPEPPSNNKILETYVKEEFENSKSNGFLNYSIHNDDSNLDTYLNSSINYEIPTPNKNVTLSHEIHNDTGEINIKKPRVRMASSRVPKFIKIIKGKSKFILKKMDTPPYFRSKPPPEKRTHSPIDLDFQSTKSSTTHINDFSAPIRITACKRLKKNISEPYSKSSILLNSVPSQTDLRNNDISISETMKIIMEQLLNHQEQMQQEHHRWMEKQFEIQRNHDRRERNLLLEELREFRKELRDVAEQLLTE